MALKPELKAWLEDVSGVLSKETRERLEQDLARDDAATKIRQTVMAQSDYSRAQDELRKEGEKLKAEADKAAQEAHALLNANKKWREDNVALYDQALKAKEQADAELALHKAKIKALAEQGLIDPQDPALRLAAEQAATTNKDQARQDFLTQEALQKQFAEHSQRKDWEYANALAAMEDLSDEHFQLTGKPLKRTELLNELKSSGGTLREVWEKKYDIPKIKADMAEKAYQERLQKDLAEALAKERSERSVDQHAFRPRDVDADPGNQHILSLFNQGKPASGLSEAVQAAKASWQKGEFAETLKPKTA